jgi:Ras association (RalGDS/AF-6) domain
LPTQEEQTSPNAPRGNGTSRTGHQTPSPLPTNSTGSRDNQSRNVHFTSIRVHHRYIPALRDGEIEEEDDEWDVEGFKDEDLELAAEQMYMQSMEEDDGMQWDEDFSATPVQTPAIPDALQPGSLRELREQQNIRAQQMQQLQQQQNELAVQQKLLLLQQQAEQATQQAIQAQQALHNTPSPPVTEELKRVDPAEVTETLKMTATPTIARDERSAASQQPYTPSIVLERQKDDERTKRMPDDEPSDESLKKRPKGIDRTATPVNSATYNKPSPSKLRKEPSKESKDTTDDEGKEKKKKSSMFGGLFGRKKDKVKETKSSGSASITSVESDYTTRDSEDSSGPRPVLSNGTTSPTTAVAQQQQQALGLKATTSENHATPQPVEFAPSTPERSITPQVSQHASQLRQRDQQQQALYQQYLNRSPSSPPEAQPSYGLQSVSAVMLSSPSSSSALGPPITRPRPGSLILTSPQSSEAQNLSVVRVFAGRSLQTEATFKTVLLNPSTTASDLVRQAIQRFRLPSAELESDYYLTIKQVEGGAFAVLEPHEHPLVVFDNLIVEATELPKVKRSSVGSISSVSSNLSMLPAIKKLSMNDFTDDSAVKFYLNRKTDDHPDDSMMGHEGDETLIAESVLDHSVETQGSKTPQYFSIPTQGPNVTPERFTSPSIRFPMQLVIYAEDLPEDMQFHPTTEAIVYKNALPDPSAPVVISPNVRRKVFMYPKNITVAEVTELGLERFGIQDGVVDGGDEVEDKTTQRRSVTRVRYGLMVSIDGQGMLFFSS